MYQDYKEIMYLRTINMILTTTNLEDCKIFLYLQITRTAI